MPRSATVRHTAPTPRATAIKQTQWAYRGSGKNRQHESRRSTDHSTPEDRSGSENSSLLACSQEQHHGDNRGETDTAQRTLIALARGDQHRTQCSRCRQTGQQSRQRPVTAICSRAVRTPAGTVPSSIASAALGIVGDKPVRTIDSLAATPSMADDAAARTAPMVAVGAGQSATAAAAIAAVVENTAIAMKHVVPWEVTWSNTVDTAQQIAAARKRFGGAGPPGTIRIAGNRSECGSSHTQDQRWHRSRIDTAHHDGPGSRRERHYCRDDGPDARG